MNVMDLQIYLVQVTPAVLNMDCCGNGSSRRIQDLLRDFSCNFIFVKWEHGKMRICKIICEKYGLVLTCISRNFGQNIVTKLYSC